MSEIVERVKAALRKSDDDYGTARNGNYWDDMARAAIEAMRDVPEEMFAPALTHYVEAKAGETLAGTVWRATIDAALKEPT